jgi:putative tributyrin esterase
MTELGSDRARISLTLQKGEYYSHSLSRWQPYAYLAPEEFCASRGGDRNYPLLVMLHGRTGCYLDWPTYTRIARYAAHYRLIVAFPEGGDGWYTNAMQGGERYEDDILQDFLPHLQQNLPLISAGRAWGIGGLSMGGYGAIKIALKYPLLFSVAISHSGSLERPMTTAWHPVFGDPESDISRRRRENLFWLAEQSLCRFPTERPRLHFDCGLSDGLLEANRRFSDHLNFLGYSHTYLEMPGHHTWPYWDRAFRTILPTIAKELGLSRAEPAP